MPSERLAELAPLKLDAGFPFADPVPIWLAGNLLCVSVDSLLSAAALAGGISFTVEAVYEFHGALR